ncbi:MAG: cellulase family glycosylhydrolase [Ginsengibacter sp.]
MKHIFTLFISIFIITISNAQDFVTQNGEQLQLNGAPYYFVGTNYWYGSLLSLQKDPNRGIKRLRNELDFLKNKGITNLRIVAGAEDTGVVSGVERIGPPLQKTKGIFDTSVIRGLDMLLYEMSKRDMKAVIYLSNNWEWSGGWLQYLKWNHRISDSLFTAKMDWDLMRDEISKFYECEPCITDYLNQVAFVMDHTNSISGTKYINDPTIMAWQMANEPRPMRPSEINAYENWVEKTASFIKSKDKNHLLSIGTEGYIGTENKTVFHKIHDNKNIDYLTIHIWPKNWQWFTGKDLTAAMDTILSMTSNYIEYHKDVAQELKKPLVIEEFGLPRDGFSFDIYASTKGRDTYFKNILQKWSADKKSNGVIAGINFWAYGGIAKPIPGQLFWKQGDDYMGDPPMEEQGLYSIFNSDKSTWKVIKRFTTTSKRKKK